MRLRWRRAWHDVIAVEGPERIEGVWWSEESGGPTRDYFRVEDRTGLRSWLFRAGLYRADDVTTAALVPARDVCVMRYLQKLPWRPNFSFCAAPRIPRSSCCRPPMLT